MRENYTPDVRHIFDVSAWIDLRNWHNDPETIGAALQFFHAVCHLLGGCEAVSSWLDRISEIPQMARGGSLVQ